MLHGENVGYGEWRTGSRTQAFRNMVIYMQSLKKLSCRIFTWMYYRDAPAATFSIYTILAFSKRFPCHYK